MPQHIVVILDIKEVVELIAACDNILYKVRHVLQISIIVSCTNYSYCVIMTVLLRLS